MEITIIFLPEMTKPQVDKLCYSAILDIKFQYFFFLLWGAIVMKMAYSHIYNVIFKR